MKHFISFTLLALCVFLLSACDTGESYMDKAKTQAFGDFKLTVNVNEDSEGRKVSGKITYTGTKEEVMVYHNDNPLTFSVREVDGDFEYIETHEGPYHSTVLKRNEPVRINSGLPFLNDLEPAMYEFEAAALVAESPGEPVKELKVMRSAVIRD